MDTKGITLVGVLGLLTIFAFAFTIPVIDHNSAVQSNEPTPATIVDTTIIDRMNDDEREYRPSIRYEYTVDGETYTESNVYPGRFERWYSSRSTAERVLERYEDGSDTKTDGEPVTAYYDPENPDEAYLYNPGWPNGWYVGAGYVLVGIAGGAYLIRKGFRRWRQRTLIQNTPTETARSLSIGPSEITGTAVTGDRGPIQAPFSDEDCVVARYEIEEYEDGDNGGKWKTIDSGVVHTPFYVNDGTGTVRVRPHDDAVYDLDPDDWSTTRVDSSDEGPAPIREFVRHSADVDFPTHSSGKNNDRRYKQNLIRPDDSAYVFGTVQTRHDVESGADNADRLVIQKVEDDSMREPMYLISDDSECSLIDRRRWALWRLPVGASVLTVAVAVFLFIFGPLLGIEVPSAFDGLIGDVS